MKKLLSLVASFMLVVNFSFAQGDVEKNINDALASLKNKNYKDVHTSLQQAITDLGMLIGQDALNLLPKELNGFKSKADEDNVSSNNMGVMTGTTIVRNYYGTPEEKSMKVSIVTNSPVIASISTIFNLPFANMGNNNGQKTIKIGTQKGMLKYDKEAGSGELQIVMGQVLITINAEGKLTEQDITKFAEKLDFAKLDALLN